MHGLSALSVLVVDDNRHMRAIAVSLLRGYGVRDWREADGVDPAWNLIRTKPADLVLVDLHMPDLGGQVLVQRIRRDPRSFVADAAIIIMTAFTDRTRVLEARDSGASEIIAKPLSAKSLLDRIVAVIDQPRPFVRATTYLGPDRRRPRARRFNGPFRRSSDGVEFADRAVGNGGWRL